MAVSYSKNTLRIYFAAFACFGATTLVFSPNTSIFSGMALGGQNMGSFIFPLFITAILSAGLFALYFHQHDPVSVQKYPLLVTSAFVQIASASVYVAANYGLGIPRAVIVLTGIFYGASLIIICLAWANVLGHVEFRSAIFYSTLVCMAAYALNILLGYIPSSLRAVCYLVVFAAGVLAPLVALRQGAPAHTGEIAKISAETSPKAPEHSSTSALLSTLRLPIVGLLLFAFMMALGKNRVFGVIDTELFAGFVAALCILPLFAFAGDKPLSSLIYRVIAPIIGGVVIVLLTIPSASMHAIGFVCVYVFLSALAILAFANVLAIINAGEFSAEFVTSLGMCAGCAVSLAGIYWAQTGDGLQDNQTAIFILIAFYCAFMMIYLGWESWKLVNAPNEERPEIPSASQDWTLRAEAAGLTKRETEILSYLGRGHSIIYIAEKLFISESTVRTHVKHIYAKLDIHAKEELFAFIDGQ